MSELEELPSWAGRRTEKVPLPKEPATPEAGPTEPAPAQSGAGPESDAGPGSPSGEPQPAQAAIQASQAADAVHLEEAQPLTVGGEPRPRGRSGWLKGLLVLLVVAALVGGGAGYVMTRDTSETEATGETGSESALADDEVDGEASEPADGATAAEGGEADTATGQTDAAETDAAETEGDETETGGDETETVTVQVDPDPTTDEGDAANGSTTDLNDGNRQAFFRGGKVYLTGAVPSEEIAQVIVEKAANVVGPDNVVNQYTVDPTVEIGTGESAPLYVEDVVLFEFNSIAVAEPFLPLLDLGVLLLRQNPQATMTVVTRTDAIGSEEVNLDVATKRGQAVLDYWISRGVDPDQVDIDARGEEGTSDDDDATTAAGQRRAEFIITGLLD